MASDGIIEIGQSISISVRRDGEWGTFNYSAGSKPDGDRVRYWGEWSANTSFGTYGHYWNSMGKPFASFVQTVGSDYLLEKISQPVLCDRKLRRWVVGQIFKARATKAEKRAAYQALKRACASYTGEWLAHRLYESDEIGVCIDDWVDSDASDYPVQAKMFVEKLWPLFSRGIQQSERAGG